jgi:hypothetical protein
MTMKHALWLAVPLLLAATQDSEAPAPLATLNVRQADGSYKLTDRLKVPADHKIHDGMIAFEGPGWESDKVAYRLYLDERNVPDIFGKKQPGAVLPKIGMGKDDYHEMADWGMDIFKVNQSLGMGGIGVLRGGKATQLGPASIYARVWNAPHRSTVLVQNRGFPGEGGPADLSTTYRIDAGSRVTHVEARVVGKVPAMAAGLTLHPGVTRIESPKRGAWRYFASWGVQSLANDELGIALFYPADEARTTGSDGATLYVEFCDPRTIRYAFAAAWVQEPGAPKDITAFRAWLADTAEELGKRPHVVPTGQKFCPAAR